MCLFMQNMKLCVFHDGTKNIPNNIVKSNSFPHHGGNNKEGGFPLNVEVGDQEKSLLCTEFLLFCNSRFICYDHPCNFSFCPPGWSNHSHWPGRNQHLHWYSDFVGQGVLEAVFVDSPKAQINHTLPAT